MDSLVSTEWLADEMGSSDLRIVDASNHLPTAKRDARAEYEAGHIPGAVYMDLAGLVDTESEVPSALPTPEMFASRMQKLGLGDGSRIVLYDDSEVKTAGRAWYMFTMFGAQNVAILDGGLAKWKREARPLEVGNQELRCRHYTAWRECDMVRSKAQMIANLKSGAEQVVDAREAGRFTGEVPDFRPGVPSGHIPGSFNLPYTELYNQDGTFKDKAGLRRAFEQAGIDIDRPIVTTCGGGVTAAVLSFALHLLGKDCGVALYDGSWSEWAVDPDTPKETGRALQSA
ncbi:MAG: 3-mercaptopyruvate sulfurtransferase [Candidatus Andeanibacterium colombiense]|uniref:Sulfurtransferase n=1 Tax=Candidatus Andeanibacterium colombiense TaxID=3121345 RepID=A0AAJ5X7P1_9SPHN|nr:MAG: 3-mercaptopyruvate sulfurtransferase [Sphingomonadaceae bacterium]